MFFTTEYKGFYITIASTQKGDEVKFAIKQWDQQRSAGQWLPAKSLHSAKCLISRWINKGV